MILWLWSVLQPECIPLHHFCQMPVLVIWPVCASVLPVLFFSNLQGSSLPWRHDCSQQMLYVNNQPHTAVVPALSAHRVIILGSFIVSSCIYMWFLWGRGHPFPPIVVLLPCSRQIQNTYKNVFLTWINLWCDAAKQVIFFNDKNVTFYIQARYLHGHLLISYHMW